MPITQQPVYALVLDKSGSCPDRFEAPEATLSREIGACFVPLTFVTVGLNDYLNRDRQKLLLDHVLPTLSMTASRVALETAARFPATAGCLCQDLKSPQPEERYSRF